MRKWVMALVGLAALLPLGSPAADDVPGGPKTPSRTFDVDISRCQEYQDRIRAIEKELEDISLKKPPFDKMDAEEIAGNIRYRRREIDILEGKRSALGCPGAKPLAELGSGAPGTGAGETGAAGSEKEPVSGKAKSEGELRLALKAYCESIPGAIYGVCGGYCCRLPNEGGVFDMGRPPGVRAPASLAQAEFTTSVLVNKAPATAGSVGEDMQGYWGAVVSWSRHGLVFNLSVTGPYPEPDKDSPETRRALYEECLKRALQAATDFDRALR